MLVSANCCCLRRASAPSVQPPLSRPARRWNTAPRHDPAWWVTCIRSFTVNTVATQLCNRETRKLGPRFSALLPLPSPPATCLPGTALTPPLVRLPDRPGGPPKTLRYRITWCGRWNPCTAVRELSPARALDQPPQQHVQRARQVARWGPGA
jgi:hypothetical protein